MAKAGITLNLSGPAAHFVVRTLARAYAIADAKSALTTPDYVNAPWFKFRKAREHLDKTHRRWLRIIAAERDSYRDALADLLGYDLPEVPTITYRPYTPPHRDVTYAGVYSAEKVDKMADEYALAVLYKAGFGK